jgi:hypothetical protein
MYGDFKMERWHPAGILRATKMVAFLKEVAAKPPN